ncbi:DUF1284 domain-containing protein [Kaistia dalseonensis]|uniref:DUF1284 domain-containing protein n=1 Tax=Kaistia dalseonensis TaxID=410840 RepID=A0ABU0HCS3_9HYPH|nr:DUF1284 domain-containing protein [Kaistia dalseonensis]MCX5497463.1 DUF1284 domain-containing protein [Kaistia dalseonensis]MDQ0440102.1 hypothetical protein [Kaistia dalseonensis]
MTVRLRAHHLLCMLTYVGKGYTADFCTNYDAIALRLGAGEDIVMVDGPDDICQPVVDAADTHCHNESVIERDAAAATVISRLLHQTLSAGASLSLDIALLKRMRDAFAAGTTRTGCGGCQWITLCDRIADGGFEGVRLTAK